MMFDTPVYWLFFLGITAAVLASPNRIGRLLLVVASFTFYGFWDIRFVALLAASTLANYLLGLAVETSNGRHKKAWLAFGISLNLITLGFFKYYNFFAGSLAALLHVQPDHWTLAIVLPVGVSFFTFEGIAYLVDIYRGDLKARRNPIDFALFISFFPHLVAGPIIRPEFFFPQVDAGWKLTSKDIRWSFMQIIKGLLKKVVLADSVATVADSYFNNGQVSAAFGVTAFTLQIYFDFSGYTDIARGCAQLLGYRFPSNFERPYLSANIAEFWRRWHISLSTWLRDYLYIPLGGSRASQFVRYRNYLIVMGLGGLWHGASWNFLFWGLYHGTLLLIHRIYLDHAPKQIIAIFATRIGTALATTTTLMLVMIGWIPFRAANLESTLTTLNSLLSSTGWQIANTPPALVASVAIFIAVHTVDRKRQLQNWLVEHSSYSMFVAVSGILLWCISIFAHRGLSVPFIYFQF